jgi:integrative and conjugative element protein (TIGR02256 family)
MTFPSTKILLSSTVVETIAADLKKHGHNKERGGILLGFRRGPHLHIHEATFPMRWDVGTMSSFRRSSNGHAEIALRRWRQSNRTTDWVGEWHSHPEEYPSPSSIDLQSWQIITRDRDAPMAFVIMGWARGWLGLCVPDRELPIRYREIERSSLGLVFRPASLPDKQNT